MQTTTKQQLLRVAAGSIFAVGTVLVPAAVASAASESAPADALAPNVPSKGPHPLPDEFPTDPAEGVPIPNPGTDS